MLYPEPEDKILTPRQDEYIAVYEEKLFNWRMEWDSSPKNQTQTWRVSLYRQHYFLYCFWKKNVFILKAKDIAWETEVWLAEMPDHMIHLNGDKFMGPRNK